MTIAYPSQWTSKLPLLPGTTLDASSMQQVVINVGEIFPEAHVEFIDRLKNVRKRSAEDDGDDDDRTKKQRGRTPSRKHQDRSNSS